jgi:hypothetical protein
MSVMAIYHQLFAFLITVRSCASIRSTSRSSRKENMSKKDLVVLVSRAFALLLITWAFVEVTYMPERVFALSHHIRQSSVLATSLDYGTRYYLLLIVFNVVRMLALFFAALLFWRCGPRVQAIFSQQAGNQAASGRETPG